MRVVVAGATGFVGRSLVKKLLGEDHSVVVLSRQVGAFKNLPSAQLKVELWDGHTVGHWAEQLEDADAVVNLSGEGIADERWTEERKRLIKASRLEATRALVGGISGRARHHRPRVLVNASAVGYYGDVPQGEVFENHPKGKDFLAGVCGDWEAEAQSAGGYDVRVVLPRFGVVLEKGGGALKKFIPPFRLFAGGPLGSGRQWFPWVHRDDVVDILLFALEKEQLSGPVNVAAPEAVTMKQFCKALGKTMHRPSWAPVPGFALKLLLGEMAGMLLTGQKAVPKKLEEAGYRFQYPALGPALSAIFHK